MKPFPKIAVTGLLLGLFVSACATDGGVSARAKEKPAAYATARTWQKSFIEKGVIANGFTSDLVYIAMGPPTTIDKKELPEGPAEMWIYARYYPNVDAVHGFRTANFTTESAYQPQRPLTQTATGEYPNGFNVRQVPLGQAGGMQESMFKTAGAQGGSMEPAGLRSYTIKVLFASGKVVQIGADENMN